MTWPFENDTGPIVKKLAARSLQSQRRRSLMVVISVALAAFLISFGGGLAVSLVQLQRSQVTDTYEAVYGGVTEQMLAALTAQPEIARVGAYYLMGEEQSERGFKGSFLYADADMLHIGRQQLQLLAGKLPEQADEIMASESWLNQYAPDAELGDAVAIETPRLQGAYRLSGIMDQSAAGAGTVYSFLVSKEQLTRTGDYDPSGYRAYVHLRDDEAMSGEEIKEACARIAARLGLPAPAYHSQYFAYTSGGADLESVSMIGLLAAVVLAGGCVVIQSIFRISVTDRIQSFGQLRTLGATKKQIMGMVRREGRRLAWLGIFMGTGLGILTPALLVPDGRNLGGYGAAAVAAALICRVMTGASIRKPVKIAAGVSPIEAVRLVPRQGNPPHSRRAQQRLSPLSLGRINFSRDRKRTVSIMVSLSVGGILLLCASTLLLTYSPEALARKYFPNGDYKLYIHSEQALSGVLRSGNPLSEALRQEILAVDGVVAVRTGRRSAGTDLSAEAYTGGGMGDMLTQDNESAVERALTEGRMPPDAHSILVHDGSGGPPTGSTLQISLGEGSAAVTVSGRFDLSKLSAGYGHGNLHFDGAMLFLPEALFEELLPGVENFDYAWEIVSDPSRDAGVRAALQAIVSRRAGLALDCFSDYAAYSRSAYSTPFHILQGVALLISLFGVINLINTTLSSQVSRRREIGVLRSVGLTKKQLYRMIAVEGVGHALSSVALTMLAGLPLAFFTHRWISAIVYGAPTVFRFPFLSMALYFLMLLAIEFLLSAWTIRQQDQQSLVEQLRTLE